MSRRRRGKLTGRDATKDIRAQFEKKTLRSQQLTRISPAQASGSVELAWLRGNHAGWHEAYLFLVKQNPRVAAKLLKKRGMDEEGSIGGG